VVPLHSMEDGRPNDAIDAEVKFAYVKAVLTVN
jgi:hypothetical protein